MTGTRSPLYAQVEDALVARLRSDLRPGDRMPSEDELIGEFGVSRITVRRAVQNLVARGLVVTRPGRGSYVAVPRITQPLTELTGFVEDMEANGLAATARVLTVQEIPAPPGARRALELPLGSVVTFIERVRLANGHPISFDRTYLVPDLGRLVARDDLANEPVFALLEQRHDTPLVEATYALNAVTADPEIAAALETPEGSAVLRIERTSYTHDDRPVDYEVLHYRGETITFTTRLPRGTGARPNDESGPTTSPAQR
ncbi:GntR family transcriptional regulator [Kribbella solani]|uniref:GntR family transcriptional regulator n=1 Tax=Kribbella solani TaxID=236067 RepID=UPI0029B4C2F9|nr:GntR family transcriptional regulator [Kribbella solani]MDX2969724.1 GntR family transcriptional regulator [Kribbella solani]